jgi:hypothetical protein
MSYSLKLADPRLKWENLLDSSPHFAAGRELHVKKNPKRELLIFVHRSKGIFELTNHRAFCSPL